MISIQNSVKVIGLGLAAQTAEGIQIGNYPGLQLMRNYPDLQLPTKFIQKPVPEVFAPDKTLFKISGVDEAIPVKDGAYPSLGKPQPLHYGHRYQPQPSNQGYPSLDPVGYPSLDPVRH